MSTKPNSADKTEAVQEPLLECPFCGFAPAIASVEPYQGAYAEFADPNWEIRCRCGISMIEKGSRWERGRGTINDETSAKEKLRQRLNTRHSKEPAT